MPSYIADSVIQALQVQNKTLPPVLFRDGSAGRYDAETGEQVLIYPPTPGPCVITQRAREGKWRVTLAQSETVDQAMDYIEDLTEHIVGPGNWTYTISTPSNEMKVETRFQYREDAHDTYFATHHYWGVIATPWPEREPFAPHLFAQLVDSVGKTMLLPPAPTPPPRSPSPPLHPDWRRSDSPEY